MTLNLNIANKRIDSIDLLRGFVMVIMALDHTRDFFHHNDFGGGATNLETTTPFFFFTRWITHFCAPVFVMLSGTSAFLYGYKNGNKEVSFFLFTRGIWLIFLELTIVRLGWSFNLGFSSPFMFQVIWAIGCSMIVLSALVWLNKNVILAIGLLLVFGHNFLDPIEFEKGQLAYPVWAILHDPSPLKLGPAHIFTLYPIIPWIGIIACGYALGQLFVPNFSHKKRHQLLLGAGLISVVLFIALRALNIYGDPEPWATQKNTVYSILSFLNTEKYPPSLLFLLMTIGPALILLRFLENAKGWIPNIFITIGRVPLFYYIVHLYLIHLGALIIFLLSGGNISDLGSKNSNFGFPEWFGYSLLGVYIAWISIVAITYPLCKWYGNMKRKSSWKGWSYL